MANMTLTKTPMPEQEPQVRAHNFKEVALGYTAEMAMEEAGRCLNCKKPKCVEGCPVNVRIPEFIAKVHEGDFKAAYEIITSTNALPALSGRVCPQESQCESKCVRGIKGESVAIGRLERFVADWYRENVNAMPETFANAMPLPGAFSAASSALSSGTFLFAPSASTAVQNKSNAAMPIVSHVFLFIMCILPYRLFPIFAFSIYRLVHYTINKHTLQCRLS